MKLRWLAITMALGILAGACSQPAAGPGGSSGDRDGAGARSGAVKRISAVIRGQPFTLSEAINAAGAGSTPGLAELQELIHAGLAVEAERGALRPRLAQELPSAENGLWVMRPDGRMQTTWKIRPNALWQDGTPFSAEDLVFTVRVALDRQVALGGEAAYRIIERTEAPDAGTFVVHWSQTYINADALFTRVGASRILPMPRHLLERMHEEDPATFTQLPYWTHEFIGLGPFKVREYLEGSHLVIDAHEQYVLGRPKVDQIEIKFMTDPGAIAANILAGAVEFTLGTRYSLEWGLQLRDQWRDGRMEPVAPTSWVALFPQLLNPTPAVLGEASFRRALLHALDRQELSDTIQAGLSPIAHGIIGPQNAEYPDVESSIARYEHDPRRAAQLIEELGLAKAADGVYRDRDGLRLMLEVRTRQGDDLQEKTLFGVIDYWQRLGLGVEPFVFPPQRANDREFRSTRPAFEVVRQPAGVEGLTRFHGAETPLPENNFQGVNRSRYRNADLDAFIDRYVATIPRRERNQILAQIVSHMTSQVVVLGVYWSIDPIMIGNRLVNVGSQSPTWNAHEWDVR